MTPRARWLLLIIILLVLALIALRTGMADSLRASVSSGTPAVRSRRIRQPRTMKPAAPAPKVIRNRPSLRNKSSAASTATVAQVRVLPPKAGCGDAIVIEGEACDDGNVDAKDGCSSACAIETGFVCNTGQPSKCWSTCGD